MQKILCPHNNGRSARSKFPENRPEVRLNGRDSPPKSKKTAVRYRFESKFPRKYADNLHTTPKSKSKTKTIRAKLAEKTFFRPITIQQSSPPLTGSDGSSQGGNHFKKISHDTIVGYLENRSLGIFVDRKNTPSPRYASHMLRRSRNSNGYI